MNAYELAEQAEGLAYEISADWSSGEPKNVATDIANMLRQQADRIAELEHMNKNWQLSETMAYNRIAELERLVSDMIYEKSSGVYDRPQIKELSDEEIEKLQAEHTEKGHFADTLNVKDFARAILKKASEK